MNRLRFSAILIISGLLMFDEFDYIQGKLVWTDSYTQPSDNAELKCEIWLNGAYSGPRAKNFKWFKEGKEISNIAGKYDLGNNTETLQIFTIDETEVGMYTCQSIDTNEEAKVYVRCGAWADNGADITKSAGETVTVECRAWGYPTPEIKWYKDGKEIKADGSHYIFEDRPTVQNNVTLVNGRLKIQGSTASDTGKYKCDASNLLGSHSASTSVLVKNPLNILWPILGIIGLLIILGVVIGLFAYFTHKYKKEQKKRNAKWKKIHQERSMQNPGQ